MTDFLGGQFAVVKKREIEREEKKRIFLEEQENRNRQMEAEATPDPDKAAKCYASNSKVYLQDMTVKAVADINIGDSLLVSAKQGKFKFSKVMMINHRGLDVQQEFCQIWHDCEKDPLTITPNHIVMVNGNAQFAGEVKMGDTLQVLNKTHICLEQRQVQKIGKISQRGFHSPITMDGKLVVDDVLTSCYGDVPETMLLGWKINGHQLAHMGMAPFRIMRKMNIATKMLEINEGDEMPQAIQWAVKRVLPIVQK